MADLDLLALARETAEAAAAHVRSRSGAGQVDVALTKSSPTDLVTEVDQSTERLIRERILRARPTDGFVGEEGEDIVGTSGVDWVVDPIDGTVNFVHQIPRYAVAVAAVSDGKTQAAAVVDVCAQTTFFASRGQGAWRLGPADTDGPVQLFGPPERPLANLVVGTGFSYVAEIRAKQGAAVARLLPQVADIRRFGAAALDLVDLAQGRLDAYVEQGLKPWDIAAGGLIATEAGIVLTGLAGSASERLVIAASDANISAFGTLVRECDF